MGIIINYGQQRVSLANRVQNLQLPVFREIATLAKKRGAINLGGGTPDFPAPIEIKEAAVTAILSCATKTHG